MSLIRIEYEGDMALVVLNSPPVNALSHALRRALYQAISDVNASDARAAIVLCDGNTFIAGADISEFGNPLLKPINPDLIAALEASPKIWVAALHGMVLGAGLELALGCDVRIAQKDTKLGFPEVTLGVIPGAGGTQRLPRLIGVEPSLDLITTGKLISAGVAHSLGLIDDIADKDLRTAAVAYVRSVTTKRHLPERARLDDKAKLGLLLSQIVKKARGQIAPVEAAHAVMLSTELPLSEGLKQEREIFETLTRSVQSRALRYQFFAEREAMKIPALKDVEPFPLQKIGVIGAGTMGSSIAAACLIAGYSVVLVDQNTAALEKAWAQVASLLDEAEQRGALGHSAQHLIAQFVATDALYELQDCQLVIEAIYEDIDVKTALFQKLGSLLNPDIVLATNTSYLDIDSLAVASGRADRFLGLHFFAPAHIMKLVEIVEGAATTPRALATGFALAKRLKKTGVLAQNRDGFIGNRIWQAYRRELEYMVEDGASPYEIDAAMQHFGFSLGPFAVADLSGLDIAFAQRKRRAASRPVTERYVEIPDMLCDQGRLGRKTNKGWYDYKDGKASPSPDVSNVIEKERLKKSIAPQSFSAQAIQARLLAVIINEAAKLLDENIAMRASDVDVVMVKGYGWPKWRGGPLFEADEIGVANMLPLLVQLASTNGLIISEGLKARAMQNKTFAA